MSAVDALALSLIMIRSHVGRFQFLYVYYSNHNSPLSGNQEVQADGEAVYNVVVFKVNRRKLL